MKPKLLTKTEFADLCGISLADLSMNIKRNKVSCKGKLIDPANEMNLLFVQKRRTKATSNTTKKEKQIPLLELERLLKEADLKKKQKEIQLLSLKERKLNGLVIPTDLVKNLFTIHFKSVYIAFEQAADNLIIEFSHTNKLSREQSAKLKERLIFVLNDAIAKGIEISKKDVHNVCMEYSETRTQGERKS